MTDRHRALGEAQMAQRMTKKQVTRRSQEHVRVAACRRHKCGISNESHEHVAASRPKRDRILFPK